MHQTPFDTCLTVFQNNCHCRFGRSTRYRLFHCFDFLFFENHVICDERNIPEWYERLEWNANDISTRQRNCRNCQFHISLILKREIKREKKIFSNTIAHNRRCHDAVPHKRYRFRPFIPFLQFQSSRVWQFDFRWIGAIYLFFFVLSTCTKRTRKISTVSLSLSFTLKIFWMNCYLSVKLYINIWHAWWAYAMPFQLKFKLCVWVLCCALSMYTRAHMLLSVIHCVYWINYSHCVFTHLFERARARIYICVCDVRVTHRAICIRNNRASAK